jgi:hypothetical protein
MGLWIFASVALFSLVFLYTKTKDEWDWKKIINISWKIGLVIVLLPVVLISIFGGVDEVNKYLDNRPKVANSYGAVKLGDKYSDVNFNSPLTKVDKYSNKDISVYSYDKRAQVAFLNSTKKLIEITQYCNVVGSGFVPDFLPINGIGCYSTAKDILDRYGKSKVRVLCEDEAKIKAGNGIVINTRVYDVPEFGVRHLLMSNQLLSIDLMDPKRLKDDIPGWAKVCD